MTHESVHVPEGYVVLDREPGHGTIMVRRDELDEGRYDDFLDWSRGKSVPLRTGVLKNYTPQNVSYPEVVTS